MQTRDEHIVSLLKSDPDQALSLLYDLYFDYLAGIVYRILPDESHTQDVVQGLFIEIWKKKDELVINSSLKQYLRRSAINRTLNLIRSRSRIQDDVDPTEVVSFSREVDQTLMLEAEELSNQIGAAIESLPERCRLIFSLSRYEDMSYREIAESLDISVKTVENQITKALKLMRDKLNKNI